MSLNWKSSLTISIFTILMLATSFYIFYPEGHFFYEKNKFNAYNSDNSTIYTSVVSLYYKSNSTYKSDTWVRYSNITYKELGSSVYIEAPMQKSGGRSLVRFFYIQPNQIKEGVKVNCPNNSCYITLIYQKLVCDNITENKCFKGSNIILDWSKEADKISKVEQQVTQLKITSKKYKDSWMFDPELIIEEEKPVEDADIFKGEIVRSVKEDYELKIVSLETKEFNKNLVNDDLDITSDLLNVYQKDITYFEIEMDKDYKVWYENGERIEPVSYESNGFTYLVGFDKIETLNGKLHVGDGSDVYDFSEQANSLNHKVWHDNFYVPMKSYATLLNYWQFNANNANQVDVINRNNGTVNGATYTASGKFNGAYSYDGVNDNLNITITEATTMADFNQTRGAISFWVYVNNNTGRIFASNDEATNDTYFMIGWTTAKVFNINSKDGTNQVAYQTPTTFTPYSWYHVVVSYDGVRNYIYVNGIDQALTNSTSALTYRWLSNIVGRDNALIGVGKRNDGYAAYFNGTIDEVMMFNKALGGAEVRQMYNANAEYYNLSEVKIMPPSDNLASYYKLNDNNEDSNLNTSMIGWWKFNVNSANQLDTIGNHNGTVNGATYTTNGFYDGAYSFDGTNDYIEVNDSDDLSFTNGIFSGCAWAYMVDATSFQFFAKTRNNTDTGAYEPEWRFFVGTLDQLYVYFYDFDGSNYVGAYLNPTITSYQNNWTHFCFTSSNNNNTGITFYINGVANTNVTLASGGTYVAMHNFPSPLDIGVRFANSAPVWSNGIQDNSKIWNRSLTASEILQDYVSNLSDTMNVFNATPYGVTYKSNGFFNGAYNFDGVNDEIRITDGDTYDFEGGGESFTISTWLKLNSLGANQAVIYKSDADNDFWRMFVKTTNVIECSADNIDADSTTALLVGQWYHVACVFDKAGNLQVYINGKADGTPVALNGEVLAIASQIVQLGDRYDGANDLNGTLDDVKIQTRALSANEIMAEYQATTDTHTSGATSEGFCLNDCFPQRGTLISQWAFNNNGLDETNVNNGTVTSATYTNGYYGQAINFVPNSYFNISTGWVNYNKSMGSVAFWIKPTTLTAGNVLALSNGSNTANYFQISTRTDGKMSKNTVVATTQTGTFGSTVIPLNSWTHVVVVSDGSTDSIYVNGIKETLTVVGANNGNWIADVPAINSAMIGAYTSFTYSNQVIDDLAIWSTPLTQQEVLKLYRSGYEKYQSETTYFNKVDFDGDVTLNCTFSNVDSGTETTLNTSSMRSYYKFNGESSTTLIDTANINNGTISGATFYKGRKGFNNALYFDGVNDKVNFSSMDNFYTNGAGTDKAWTISSWIKPVDATSFRLLTAGLNNTAGYRTMVSGTSATELLVVGLYEGAGSTDAILVTTPAVTSYENNWIHAVYTYNGNESATGFNVYLNGVAQTLTLITSGTYTGVTASNYPFYIGYEVNTETYSKGYQDQTVLYNYSMTASEVLNLYKSELNANDAGCDSDASLIAQYKLNGDVNDCKGINNGTNNGSTSFPDAVFNGGYTNDAVNDDIIIPFSSTFNTSGQTGITVSAWIYNFGATSSTQGAVTKWDTNTMRIWSLQTDVTDQSKLAFYVSSDGNYGATNRAMSTTTVRGANTWQHAVGTWSSDGTVKIYINGVLENSATTTITSLFDANNPLYIGSLKSAGVPSNRWNGSIDDVRIYNRTFNRYEVWELFNAESNHTATTYTTGQTIDSSSDYAMCKLSGIEYTYSNFSFSNETTISDINANVTLNSPDNGATFSNDTLSVLLNATFFSDANSGSLLMYFDTVDATTLNQTNSSLVNNTEIIVNVSVSQGNTYYWKACVNNTFNASLTCSDVRNFIVNATTGATTTIPSNPWFNLVFKIPWEDIYNNIIYSLGFETNASGNPTAKVAESTLVANTSLGALLAPIAISKYDNDNQIVKNYFGNIIALPIVYDRNYSIMFMLNTTSTSGQSISVPINITQKMEAYSKNWTIYEILNNQSLYLTAGTIYGGILNDSSNVQNISFYVDTYTG